MARGGKCGAWRLFKEADACLCFSLQIACSSPHPIFLFLTTASWRRGLWRKCGKGSTLPTGRWSSPWLRGTGSTPSRKDPPCSLGQGTQGPVFLFFVHGLTPFFPWGSVWIVVLQIIAWLPFDSATLSNIFLLFVFTHCVQRCLNILIRRFPFPCWPINFFFFILSILKLLPCSG